MAGYQTTARLPESQFKEILVSVISHLLLLQQSSLRMAKALQCVVYNVKRQTE